jgi:CubicO group peptidase (beta-lactamase class C family)
MDLATELADWPVSRAGAAVIGRDGVLARFEIDDGKGPYVWKSVTKILTALTALDGCADGTIALDEPAGPRGATVAHLLAHAAGLPFEKGDSIATPGTRRTYSNYGYDLLADHLSAKAGGPFVDELQGRVLTRLGMTATELHGPPSSGAVGTLDDLAKLAAELLTPAVLGSEIVQWASTVAFPGLAGVLPGFGRQTPNDWGLGCEIRDSKNPHWTSPSNSARTFGHFGQSGSFLWVDPEAQIACVSLSDTGFGPWAAQCWPRLSSCVLENFGN